VHLERWSSWSLCCILGLEAHRPNSISTVLWHEVPELLFGHVPSAIASGGNESNLVGKRLSLINGLTCPVQNIVPLLVHCVRVSGLALAERVPYHSIEIIVHILRTVPQCSCTKYEYSSLKAIRLAAIWGLVRLDGPAGFGCC
jgi:hypothetical protein